MSYFGGFDIGSTGCKIAIYDDHAKLIATFYEDYSIQRNNGYDEINLEIVYEKVLSILSLASEKYVLSAVAFSSFGETFAMLDENDKILTPSMIYTDKRGKEEVNQLIQQLGAKKIATSTGVYPHEMYSLPKIMWIKNNLPEQYKKVKKILLCQDFIIYKLTGIAQIDYSLAARTLLFNIREKKYDEEIAKASGIDLSFFSKPVQMGTLAGKIKKNIATTYQINNEMKIYNGCHDQIANMFGAGIFQNQVAMDGCGTVECLCAIFDQPPDFSFYQKGYCCIPYLNGKYATYAFSYGGCACINTFKEKYARYENQLANQKNLSYYDVIEEEMPDAINDILILPYFGGAGTPYMDSQIRGSILNLSFEHTLGDIYKALLESIAFELKINVDLLARQEITFEKIRAAGGGSNSKKWIQMKSDILNKEIIVLDCKEIGCAGTALIVLLAMGIFNTIEEGFAKMNQVKYKVEPNAHHHKIYQAKYQQYKKLYATIKSLNKEEKKGNIC